VTSIDSGDVKNSLPIRLKIRITLQFNMEIFFHRSRKSTADTGALADSQRASECIGCEVAAVYAEIKSKGRH
jgi:hypothetical protein